MEPSVGNIMQVLDLYYLKKDTLHRTYFCMLQYIDYIDPKLSPPPTPNTPQVSGSKT